MVPTVCAVAFIAFLLIVKAPSQPLSWNAVVVSASTTRAGGAVAILAVAIALAITLQPLQFRLVQLLEVVPIFAVGGLLSFGRAEWNALVDTISGHDEYRIVITRKNETAQIYGDYCGVRSELRPSEIVFACEGSGELHNMRWSSWGEDEALGTGTAIVNDCTPSCGGGQQYTVPVAVRLSAPKRAERCDVRWYSTITYAYTGKVPPKAAANINSTYLGHLANTLTDHGSPC